MAFQQLDVSSAQTVLQFSQLTQLDGLQYLLDFTWDSRVQVWYLDISDQDSNPLALHIPLVVNWSLLFKFRFLPNIPPGFLLCADQSGMDMDIVQPTDLGSRVTLNYITADDPSLVGLTF